MEENTTPHSSLIQHSIRWALIFAGISITLTIVIYVIDYSLMVQLKYLFFSLLIYFGLTIYAGINYRNSIGGFLSYGKAFQHGLLALALSGLIGVVFNFLLFHVIDPELPQKLVDASLDNTREIMEKFGAPEDKIDEALAKARDKTADQFTIGGQALGYFWIVVFSAIMSLISSLFVRKNQPEVI